MKIFYVAGLSVLLGACGTFNYVPEEYPITQERIPDFNVRGSVAVENIQNDQTVVKFFNGYSDWQGSYKTVTEHLAKQLEKEIKNNGRVVNSSSKKTIQVKVVHLNAVQQPFHFNSSMRVQVNLGNGTKREIFVTQGSPGNMWRVLNGTIALGVIDILKDSKVKEYLAQ